MTINQKINGLISFASNSPDVATGYGQQAGYLVNHLIEAGIKTAFLSNYGLEGYLSTLKLPAGEIPHYPRGMTGFSGDVIPWQHRHFRESARDLPNALFLLYDAWVFNGVPELDKENIVIWVPIDHITLPPGVATFLKKPNVTAISMSPSGKMILDTAGIESTYIPHVIDTKTYKPTFEIRSKKTREFLGISEDDFLVGMVAANKSNGVIHRKAFAENLLAFSMFQKNHPEAKLYIHSEPSKAYNGFDLFNLIRATGIKEETVILPDAFDYRFGLRQEEMAALYTSFDVLLATSYGEGFGVPTLEAQACGTRAIVSNWTASPDIVSSASWKVEGFPFWDESQLSWWKIPIVESILYSLEQAYKAERGVDKTSIEFASQFENKKIWKEKWLPFWSDYFAKQSNNSSSK